MATLKDILYKITLQSASGDMNMSIGSICFDSREVAAGALFVAVKGITTDGHDYITQAVSKGAVAVVCEVLPETQLPDVAYLQTEDSALALGVIAANFYNNPADKLHLVGITGTNGKTTTVTLLFHLFLKLGYTVGLLSTVENRINGKVLPARYTTPDAIELNRLLSEMVQAGCTHCFMEVSSHALIQRRVAGIRFKGGVFTNITHDHLDYHETFDAYIKAKKLLFDSLPKSAFALTNTDDKRGSVMLQNTVADKRTFGFRFLADYKSRIINNTLQGLELEVEGRSVWFRLAGQFNAYNLLAAYAVAMELGEESENTLMALSELKAARGRFDVVDHRSAVTAIVDYAHTPDALENVLKTIADFRTGNEQLITVVGCGGDRDKAKRPLMAQIAARFSDKVILTSDNPRTEDPLQILREMEAGVSKSNYKKTLTVADRREAIKTACSLAKKADIILVAGKGHESYQEINGVKHPFDDKEVLAEMLEIFKED
ncbi:MAG: UDP-N-acetylmuramoyl-L-alanyl-D-glutamate--2,6-diaminopimelate ligase [Bacteroidota bacterium]